MNMHVDLPVIAGPRPDIRLAVRREDRDLILLCLRAKRLFERERAAEQRSFDVMDAGRCNKRQDAAHTRALAVLMACLEEVSNTMARTGEGLAYKAALLPFWLRAGLDLSEGVGQDLALSIASDARGVGLRDVTLATSQRPRPARPPRSKVGHPAHI